MLNINFDFSKIVGKIKPMHAVGQPPFTGGFAKLDFSPMQVLSSSYGCGSLFVISLPI